MTDRYLHQTHHADPQRRLGIDMGATTMKAAIVDIATGTAVTSTVVFPSPEDPDGLVAAVGQLCKRLEWRDAFGCALPSVVRGSRLSNATNLSSAWSDVDLRQRFIDGVGRAPALLNDADAAGLAEIHFGGAGRDALEILLTFGTGIGSAMLAGGRLLPNSELGELAIDGLTFEQACSARTIERKGLSAAVWIAKVEPYFEALNTLLSPVRWIIAGGLTDRYADFFGRLDTTVPVVPATLRSGAGVVGAALAASIPTDVVPTARQLVEGQ